VDNTVNEHAIYDVAKPRAPPNTEYAPTSSHWTSH